MDSFKEPSLTVFAPTALKIAQDISGALTYLIHQDITHGDFKPDNVLVSNGHYSGYEKPRASGKYF